MSGTTIQRDRYSCVFSFSSGFAPDTVLLAGIAFLLVYFYFTMDAGSIYALSACLCFVIYLFKFVRDSRCDGLIAVDSDTLRWLKRHNNTVEHLTVPLIEIEGLDFQQPTLRIWGWGHITVATGNQKLKMLVFVPIGMRSELNAIIHLVSGSIQTNKA